MKYPENSKLFNELNDWLEMKKETGEYTDDDFDILWSEIIKVITDGVRKEIKESGSIEKWLKESEEDNGK